MRKSIATQILGSLALLLSAGLVLIPAAALAGNGKCADSQSTSPHADPDQDGLSNEEEDLLGTLKCNDDTDGDGILDGVDNCATIANADQSDTNDDGFGILCDCDYNGDIEVDEADLAMIKKVIGTVVADSGLAESDPNHPIHADHDEDGVITFSDFAAFRLAFGQGPMVDSDDDGVVDVVVPGPAVELLYHY